MSTCTCDTALTLGAIIEGRTPPPCEVHDHTKPSGDTPGLNSSALEASLRTALGADTPEGVHP